MDTVVERLRAAGCVFAEAEAAILVEAARTDVELDAMVARRAEGEPLEYVVGWAEFAGRKIAVAPGVFVPRKRTELLLDEAVARTPEGATVVELCAGAGAVSAALTGRVAVGELHAADIDPDAVACARRNVKGAVYQGDLFEPLPDRLRGNVDVLIANAPYVPTDDIAYMPAEAREHEHRVALDGGADGLDVLRRVIEQAPRWLKPGGVVLVEAGRDQAAGVEAAMRACGLEAVTVTRDDATAVIGTKPRRRASHP